MNPENSMLKRRNTIMNNRKVIIMPKEESVPRQIVAKNLGNSSLSDASILKLVETAMEEMVRFEVNEATDLNAV
jgi:hypothetical protein